MSDLKQVWDVWLNGPLPLHPDVAYVLVSLMRLLLAVAAWYAIRAIVIFGNTATPEPRTMRNRWYWLTLWFYVQMSRDLLLKVGFGGVALLLVLQIPGGSGGALNYLSRYMIGVYTALFIGLLGLAIHFNRRSSDVQHPEQILK